MDTVNKPRPMALHVIEERVNSGFYKTEPQQLLFDIEFLVQLEADINTLRLRLALGTKS